MAVSNYLFYFNNILLPITPESISTEISGNNRTIDLINEGEVNRIKGLKLTKWKFKIILPHYKLPFSNYKDGIFRSPSYYLSEIEKLKLAKKPFNFKVLRNTPTNIPTFDTTSKVTLEEYTIEESRENGLDVLVDITLKQWRDYGVTTLVPKPTPATQTQQVEKSETKSTQAEKPANTGGENYTIKSGDTLWALAKKYYGNGASYPTIYNANKDIIESEAKKHKKDGSANGHWIYPGTVITIPAKG